MSFRDRRLAVGLLFSCLLISTSAHAVTTLFGPSNYGVTAGAPQSSLATFLVDTSDTCGSRASYFLLVSDENTGVSSATVTLNGVTLLTERDFPLRSAQLIPFAPLSVNTLAVTVKGGNPGATLRITAERRIEEIVSGPATVQVTKGTTTSTFNFDVQDASLRHVLLVQNGAGGAPWIANAGVLHNGNAIVSGSDFGASTGTLVRLIPVVAGSNTITVTAAGQAGSALALTVERELDESACGLRIAIQSPADSAVVSTRRVRVSGTVSGPHGIGVAVNGTPAQIDLTAAGSIAEPYRWFAQLNVAPGEVKLEAVGTAPSHATVRDTRTITFQPSSQSVFLDAEPASGAVPLTVHFHLANSVRGPIANYAFDLDGDGQYELSSPVLPDDLAQIYQTAGLRTVRARITAVDGRTFDTSTDVAPERFKDIDEPIRACWSGFTAAMMKNDAVAAAAFLAGKEATDKYSAALQALAGAGRLSTFAASIQDIRPVWAHGNVAHYLMVKTEVGEQHGYHVYFVRDQAGIWRILQF